MNVLKPSRLIPVSLLLLFMAYLVVGWNWATYQQTWTQSFAPLRRYPESFWPGAVLITLLTVAICTEPLAEFRRWVKQRFESDTRIFFAVICLTSLAILLLVHMDILAKGLLLLGAIALARFDFQLARLRRWTAFFCLAIVAVAGLLAGAGGYWAWGYYGLPGVVGL